MTQTQPQTVRVDETDAPTEVPGSGEYDDELPVSSGLYAVVVLPDGVNLALRMALRLAVAS